ncbi:hypothetical protein FOMPIDRAFT_1030188 [Fomitopsis schrenkii]|uniref:DNA polymerase n=1 Tax=Fomitopsis schrenkii TaxID=2126942 RepID=S8FRY6_FOMSC|nr:hypothetical protein FOMPIDRAFT_1030188 [Fomitopsis schrenkii]
MTDRVTRNRNSKPDKLAGYKRAREGGSRVLKDDEDVDIYDVVSDEKYHSIVRGRLAKDDFVVDDGVQGYMDNGVDDLEESEGRYESEEEPRGKGKGRKVDAKGKGKAKGKPKAPPPSATPAAPSAYRPQVSEAQEEDMMAGVLASMDANADEIIQPQKSRKRKPEPDYRESSSSPIPHTRTRPPAHSYRSTYPDTPGSSSDVPLDDNRFDEASSDDLILSPRKKLKTDTAAITPAIERMSKMEVYSSGAEDYDTSFDDMDMNAFMEIDEDELNDKPSSSAKSAVKTEVDRASKPLHPTNGKLSAQTKKKQDETPAWLSVYESLQTTTDDSLGMASGSRSSANNADVSVLEEDGSFRFFWIDYLEHDGKVYFVGKIQDKVSKGWHSCCVTVENLQRNLFLLPRERRMEQDEETGELCATDIKPEMSDVYADFDRIRQAVGIKSWKGKAVKRDYAFGEKDIPRGENEWLKVVYGFDEPQIHSSVCTQNIAKIMGTNTSAFELLVLKRKIMGPCWLQIKKPHMDHKGVSWCKVEATVSDPKDIQPISDRDPTMPKANPPLTVMSLSIRTIVNHKENHREIICATARIWSNIDLDDPTPPEALPCSVRTFVRPLDRFPPNFEVRARKNGKGVISPMSNERMLLNSLLVTIHKSDPDIILGHEFLGVSLDVLLHRMRDLKADHWSRIGRFRRSKWPSIGRQGTNLKFMNGRLLCDLASDSAKGMISSTTWSLTEMCKTHLKSDRQDIDPDDTASYFDSSVSSPDRLLTFVRHCELDAHYQMALAAKVQILPLTRQLTNLAGNSWNKTLNGGRAERNEYILLHEFHQKKYICPDKTWGKKAAAAEKEHNEDGEGGGKTKSKRDKYKGGLVFEPKRGLWDKYILVMDFNSLYPSIIQEYNIDFTTVDRVDDEDGEEKIPEPPSSEIPQGVLPRLIATLVARRRQVKSMMKDRTATQAQLLQWDIKQMALKLTANSMYGCLGFEYSRFYARPLAALTTFKGREILTHTRELAESLQLDVVYGDTDSVFVNSNVTDLAEALKISATFKKAVNDRYKLLEIDLDGVFQRLLLLQKKKYAAIKVEDGTRTSTEIKGLDMKRREYSVLSKNVSQYVLDQILSGEATEVVVEKIHEYLMTVGEDVRAGKVKLDDFIIFKRLGKNPEDYPDAKSQPHVQVALRMKARGGTGRAGDVIPYVFCLGDNGESAKSAQADKAKHPDEVRRAASELKIDYEYYLSQQILPPVERLCEPIEGTDRARLAECLGLDASRYRVSTAESEERQFGTLDSLMSDAERYKDAEPFIVRCRGCQGQVTFEPISDRENSLLFSAGATCPGCKTVMRTASLQAQLEAQIRAQIARYYEGWTVCDDPTCGQRTRMMGVYGRRCLRPGCQGHVAFEYSDAQLYTQLRYYGSLFSVEDALKKSSAAKWDELHSLVLTQGGFMSVMTATVDKYLDQSGRRWVNLTSLFSFMKM